MQCTATVWKRGRIMDGELLFLPFFFWSHVWPIVQSPNVTLSDIWLLYRASAARYLAACPFYFSFAWLCRLWLFFFLAMRGQRDSQQHSASVKLVGGLQQLRFNPPYQPICIQAARTLPASYMHADGDRNSPSTHCTLPTTYMYTYSITA